MEEELLRRCFIKTCNRGRIHYVDFVSLYPSIQFYCGFPIVDVDEQNNEEFLKIEMNKNKSERHRGFIKCKILPPCSLYFPVLPVRIDSKLCFPLCLK